MKCKKDERGCLRESCLLKLEPKVKPRSEGLHPGNLCFIFCLELEQNFTEAPGGTTYEVLNDELKAFKLEAF